MLNWFPAEIDLNAQDEEGLTALHWSSAYGQVPTAALLLNAGALASLKGQEGETALHMAAAGGHTEIIRLLLAAGASVDEPDDVGVFHIFNPVSSVIDICWCVFIELQYSFDVRSSW